MLNKNVTMFNLNRVLVVLFLLSNSTFQCSESNRITFKEAWFGCSLIMTGAMVTLIASSFPPAHAPAVITTRDQSSGTLNIIPGSSGKSESHDVKQSDRVWREFFQGTPAKCKKNRVRYPRMKHRYTNHTAPYVNVPGQFTKNKRMK